MADDIIKRLRGSIRDERYNIPAFTLSITDKECSSAILEIDDSNHLILTPTDGVVEPLVLDLSSDEYNPIGTLCRFLQKQPGLSCTVEDQEELSHDSTDLEPKVMADIKRQSITLRHRMFSDGELLSILRESVGRHNPSYTPENLPNNEVHLVFMLAQSAILRSTAMDASKRKNQSEPVSTLLMLARSYEDAYDSDLARLQRVIPSPKLSPEQQSQMGPGDVVVGTFYRRSARNGYMTPSAAVVPPNAAMLIEPRAEDIQDMQVTLRWLKNSQDDFYSYELWRDTTENVMRSYVDDSYMRPPQSMFDRPSGSVLVYRSYGPCIGGAAAFGQSMSMYADAFGQMCNAVTDQNVKDGQVVGLEPETTYYYRLYVIDRQGGAQASDVMSVTTLQPRSRLLLPTLNQPQLTPIDVASGPVGTVITLQCTYLQADSVLLIDGRPLDDMEITVDPITEAGTITGKIPKFRTMGPKDIRLLSPNGLVDFFFRGFTLVPPSPLVVVPPPPVGP